ncbi:MAG: GNAT family N-acetyltransferase, partial [Spirochaetales bacterium]
MPFEQKLDNGLLLRYIRDEKDIERFTAFSTEINNRMEGLTSNCLLKHFPRTEGDNFQIIENPETGEIVSTTCFMPWKLNFGGVSLESAMPEMILTKPSHRKMGLAGIQMNRLALSMKERQFDLSILWGIPYYYRQFGYSYAVEGMVTETLHPRRIFSSIGSAGFGASGKLVLKKAGIEDIPILEEYYEKLIKPLDIYIERGKSQWTYMIRDAKMSILLAINKVSGTPEGYIIKALESPPGNLFVLENSIPSHEDAMEVLWFLGKEYAGELKLRWPQSSTLVKIARELGSTTNLNTQWLFMIMDITAFFTKLLPVFNSRLAASSF